MDKRKLIIMAVLTTTLLMGIVAYAHFAGIDEGFNVGDIIALAIPLIIIVFMIFFIIRRYKDVKAGMPLEDERSKKVVTMAAAKSFYVSLYWLLAISWFDSLFAKMFGAEQLTASQTTGGGIAGMALLFFGFWFYYDRKGKLI